METKKDYIKAITAKFTEREIKSLGFKARNDFTRKLKQWDKWQLKDVFAMFEVKENAPKKIKET